MNEKIKIKSAAKDESLVIKTNNTSGTTKLEINFGGVSAELKATQDKDPKNTKLKYKVSGKDGEKSLFASVKRSGGSDFKLVSADDKLLWKVKVTFSKIKISNNEEGNNSLEIKYAGKKGKIKVYDSKGVNIAAVKSGSGKLKVKKVLENSEKEDLYSTKDINYDSRAIGVLAFNEIPVKERAIILTELLRKGE